MEGKLWLLGGSELTEQLVVVLWTTLVSAVLVLLYLLNHSAGLVGLHYDQCCCLTYRHQYVVRLLTGPRSSTFNDHCTTVVVELHHHQSTSSSKARTVRIPFSPMTMKRAIALGPHRQARMFLRSKVKYGSNNLRDCVLNHNGIGSVLVAVVQVQHVDQSTALTALVGAPVFSTLTQQQPNVKTNQQTIQMYPFNYLMKASLEPDLSPTPNVTHIEVCYLLYPVINLIYLLAQESLHWHCTGSARLGQAQCGMGIVPLVGLEVGVIAFLSLVVLLLPIRFALQPYYHCRLGRGCSAVLRTAYLTMVMVGGLLAGVYCGAVSLRPDYSATSIRIENRLLWLAWLGACVMALMVTLILAGVTRPLVRWCGWLYWNREDKHDTRQKVEQGIDQLIKMARVWYSGGQCVGAIGDNDTSEASAPTTPAVSSNEVSDAYNSVDAFDAAARYMHCCTIKTVHD